MRDFADSWTKTTCPYCGVGCGVLVNPSTDGEAAEIKGDPDHPANYGRLCSKGSALGETLSLDDRLLHPLVAGRRAKWDDALDLVAEKFSTAIAEHGPDSVAFYVSGQILTEDYYIANKLMKGFIGSANIDTNSRLCMASSVAGHKRAFGSDTVPGTYEDLERADLVVLVGSNLAWCHPVLFQRLAAAREERGTKVVVIDPRETATCDIADQHLSIDPGTDVALFNGLLAHLVGARKLDCDYLDKFCDGFDAALGAARQMSDNEIASVTGLTASDIETFYGLFSTTENVVTVYSQGVNQSSAGTDKVNAILNCHLATGRIGKPGSGPFSVTGQPNAMGGRETGGLANMLAAHMELANPDHRKLVQNFWQSPRIASVPGLKAVDLFQAVAAGEIKALWIMATNPVDSLPDADAVRAAIEACPFVVVSDVAAQTDTTQLADVLLPAAAWGEKDGTVTNSERRISRQKAFLPLPAEVKPDWWHLCEVAKRMGFDDAFTYAGPSEIFAEYAALTGQDNDGRRDLDISALADINVDSYDRLEPFQWPRPAGSGPRETRFFVNGQFYTPSRKAQLIATPFRGPASQPSAEFPLLLNTGRIRDQWHTMTRTAKTARLTSHCAEPFVEIHPADAKTCGLVDADLAVLTSPHGRYIARGVITDRVKPGAVFSPLHWTDQFTSQGRICSLIADHTDPVSGQPELKYTPVQLQRLEAQWFGFATTTHKPNITNVDYAAIAPAAGSNWRVELADCTPTDDWAELANRVLRQAGAQQNAIDIVAYHDNATGQHRYAAFDGERCTGMLFLAPQPVTVARTWAIVQVGATIDQTQRLLLLAGRGGADVPDKGPIVCSCFEVGRNQIARAIAQGGCESVAEVGLETGAGTNCGSCRAEIGRLIHDADLAKAI
ncbi:MAG: nitrate reductase [Pseudomonadota bacterium]